MDQKSFSAPDVTEPQARTSAFLSSYTARVQETLERLPWAALEQCVEVLHQARLCRANVFICGNGGSWATASHMVNDLNKGAMAPGVPRFRAMGLGDNVPLLTAWSNDDSYDRGFVEPLRNLAQPGDLLIGISCSGSSRNVIEAVRYGRQTGMFVIGLTGDCGGELLGLCDLPIVIANDCVEQLEDVHMFLDHLLVSALRDRAAAELGPNLMLPSGRGATPQHPVVSTGVPARPAVLLDRDGVINANRPDHVTSWGEVSLLPGAVDTIAALSKLGVPIVVITNQAAIARGQVAFDMVDSINLRLMRLIAAKGGRIDAVVSCPHHPDQHCTCRKPEPGMLTYAAECLRLDLGRSVMVGDALSDAQAAQAVGVRPILVRSGRTSPQALADANHVLVVDDLSAAGASIAAFFEE